MSAPEAIGSRHHLVFISILALLAGGSINLFLLPVSFVFQHRLDALGTNSHLLPDTAYAGKWSKKLMDWIRYSLPNGLWALAYGFLICLLWTGFHSLLWYFLYANLPPFVLGFEDFQGLGIIRGTCSYSDLFTSLTGLSFGISIPFIIHQKRNHEIKEAKQNNAII